MVEILFIAACAVLWRLGGSAKAKWSGYRDVLIPVALGMWYGITLVWWMLLVVAGMANTIRMGYGTPTPDDKKPSFLGSLLKVSWKIRAAYGLITSLAIGLFPAIFTGSYLGLVVYVVFNVALEIALVQGKARDIIAEPAIGAARASIILLCR